MDGSSQARRVASRAGGSARHGGQRGAAAAPAEVPAAGQPKKSAHDARQHFPTSPTSTSTTTHALSTSAAMI